jgi:hypothetical protein
MTASGCSARKRCRVTVGFADVGGREMVVGDVLCTEDGTGETPACVVADTVTCGVDDR